MIISYTASKISFAIHPYSTVSILGEIDTCACVDSWSAGSQQEMNLFRRNEGFQNKDTQKNKGERDGRGDGELDK